MTGPGMEELRDARRKLEPGGKLTVDITGPLPAADAPRPILPRKIEQALVEGDLSNLTAEERVQFYNATCDSLGINPFTKPFGYIVLNGKLTLYALKACTDQLRDKHGISIGQLREQLVDGVYIVFAPATDPTGRTDEDMGAVNIANLRGEALANAKMKAVTKAKRRVTLSICGLGWLDETEVETIKDAKPELRPPPPISMLGEATGTPLGESVHGTDTARDGDDDPEPADAEVSADTPPARVTISEAQFRLLMAETHKGRGEAALRDKLKRQLKLEHIHELPLELFDAVLSWAKQKPVGITAGGKRR